MEKATSGETAVKDTLAALQRELDSRNERISSMSNDVEQLHKTIDNLKKLLEDEKENAEQVSNIKDMQFPTLKVY